MWRWRTRRGDGRRFSDVRGEEVRKEEGFFLKKEAKTFDFWLRAGGDCRGGDAMIQRASRLWGIV